METIVSANPKIMHGAPCFAGTRVTIQGLFDHLEAGYSIDEYLEEFPSVTREQVVGLLHQLNRQAQEFAFRTGA
jgi:uncharacterized protein (DUF433 family)